MDRVEKKAPWRVHEEWRESAFTDTPFFGPMHEATFHHEQVLTVDEVVDRFRSVSHVAVLDPDARAAVLDEVRATLAAHPDTAGRNEVAIPYRVDAYWSERILYDGLVRADRARRRRLPRSCSRRSPTRNVCTSGPGSRSPRPSGERQGDPAPGGVGAIRRLGRAPMYGREQITEYDAPVHMAYTILSGIPVRGYHADVDLRADEAGTTISWTAAFEPKIPGTGVLLAVVLQRTVLGYACAAAAEAERRVSSP